ARRTLQKYRMLLEHLSKVTAVSERTKAALRLIDEYLSLTVEQFFRKSVTDMDALPRNGQWIDLRKELMAEVISEESYREGRGMKSVLNPTGDNEEYMQRIGILKKFCQNILFLQVRR